MTVDNYDYIALNARIALKSEDGGLQLQYEKESVESYVNEIGTRLRQYPTEHARIADLVNDGYYDPDVFSGYCPGFAEELKEYALSFRHEFPTLMSALKFYGSYAMLSRDNKEVLETFEDRAVMNALFLGGGDAVLARGLVKDIIENKYQPATPTFLNAGKKQRGEFVSCFSILVEDDMNSIGRSINTALQLSKRGGGVALGLTDIRESGAPIKGIEGAASGVVPVMKLYEDSFSYANQLGQRQGAGAVYISAHHPDVMKVLDTKRENADEKIRIKTLSVGLVVPDITFQLTREGRDMALFSPYDVLREYGKPLSTVGITENYEDMVHNGNIRKSYVSARTFLTTVAEIQAESGYPYLMFEDNVNRDLPVPGKVVQSNLCVTGETMLLTDSGYRRVDELYKTQEDFDVVVDRRARDMDVNAKGLSVESSTRMALTARDADILQLTTREGYSIRATPWHKMYVLRDENLSKIPLSDVAPGDLVPIQPDAGAYGLDHHPDLAYPWAVVESIIPDGTEDVYDVTVENGHSVIFNGIATGQCSEILQPQTHSVITDEQSYEAVGYDVICNLGSLNVAHVLDGGNVAEVVDNAVRALNTVNAAADVSVVPSVRHTQERRHPIGLGAMNFHGALAVNGIMYGSPESIEFANAFFSTVNFWSIHASMNEAIRRNESFEGFEDSAYFDGSYFTKYTETDFRPSGEVGDLFREKGFVVPGPEDWENLSVQVALNGLYNSQRMALAPTGSISYLSGSTASVWPVVGIVENRKEGRTGRVYVPAYGLSELTALYYVSAYDTDMDEYLDVIAAIQQHVDQGISTNLFFKGRGLTTAKMTKAQIKAWKKGLKSLYYTRIQNDKIIGQNSDECVSCTL